MKNKTDRSKLKILCISSGGGHWAELIRLSPAFKNIDTVYASTHNGYAKDVKNEKYKTIPDANRHQVLRMLYSFFRVFLLVLIQRPNRIISTGALPGLFSIIIGKFLGAKTIWVDSIANYEELSMSGKYAKRFADLYLVQWEHLVKTDGPFYKGKVL